LVTFCRQTRYIALFERKNLIYGIASWWRVKYISCTISRYWKMKGSTEYVSILFKLLFIGATSVKSQPILQVALKVFAFKSIKEIVAGNFIPYLLIGITNMFTVLFKTQFSYKIDANHILCIMCHWYLIGIVENVTSKPQFKNVD